MGFRIFASGTDNFSYERSNCGFEDVFNAATVLSILDASRGGVASAGASVAENAIGSAGTRILQAATGVAGAHLLGMGLNFVLMFRDPTIFFLSAVDDRLIGGGSGATSNLELTASTYSPTTFLQFITPPLEAANLNNDGALHEIGSAMCQFAAVTYRMRPSRLNINLYR